MVFKRLFISLIILSALTSDASAFTAYMLSAGLSPECWLDQLNQQLEQHRILPETAGSLRIAAADEVIQKRMMQGRLDFLFPDTVIVFKNISSICPVDCAAKQLENRDITYSSDPSPPYC